jgi:hypothetical protein
MLAMPEIKVLLSGQFSEQAVPAICNREKNVTVYTVAT